MELSMTTQMRLEQRMKLAPRMIQSMEILQLPLLALQERIDQELNSNPVLEQVEPAGQHERLTEPAPEPEEPGEKVLVIGQDKDKIEDFRRLDSLDDDFQEYVYRSDSPRFRSRVDEHDLKLEAMQNTAAGPKSLHEHLTEQWRLVDAEEPVKKAGSLIVDYLDEKGYLTLRLEQLHNKDRSDFTIEHLNQALMLVQKLDPSGVGARDLRECLLIQMDQSSEDWSFEQRLIAEHIQQLLENHLPEIAKKMNTTIKRINGAIRRLSKLDTSPGLQIAQPCNYIITPDLIVEPARDSGAYTVRFAGTKTPPLRISRLYEKMAGDPDTDQQTRKFLQANIRSAHWLIDAIRQRRQTLLRVARAVIAHQSEFFDKGTLYLKPLPMSKVAEQVGVHVATVSRAVAGKYIQCPQGVLPLRSFFSGGLEDDSGQPHSWQAIREKLREIIEAEDKKKPLSDDQIREKLARAGFSSIARRTVAKYRNLLNIPSARLRRKY
jgi:RNA polymerase sigma-54 factor